MFIGHFAAGIAVKSLRPQIKLGTALLAVMFLDLLWPVFLLLKVEHVSILSVKNGFSALNFFDYPLSHSLIMTIGWSFVFAVVYYLISSDKKSAVFLFFAVVSHWFLDLVVHTPDLPVDLGNYTKFGFGLWNSVVLTILLETTLFVAAILMYVNMKNKANFSVEMKFWFLIVMMYLVYLMNAFGPPPADIIMLAWGAQLQWIFIFLAYWIDYENRRRVNN